MPTAVLDIGGTIVNGTATEVSGNSSTITFATGTTTSGTTLTISGTLPSGDGNKIIKITEATDHAGNTVSDTSLETASGASINLVTPMTWGDVEDQITTSSGSTTITITNDITVDSMISILTGKDITITSNGNYTLTRGNFTQEFFNITGSSLTLEAGGANTITLDGNQDSSGTVTRPLIFVNSGSLTLGAGSILEKNYASSNGGAVQAIGGTVTVSGGIIRNNKTTATNNRGGGLYITNAAFTMSSGSIYGNTSASTGGGINLYNCTSVSITGGAIYDNDAGANTTSSEKNGGGIYIQNNTASISNVSIYNNSADANGGGICVNNATLTLEDVYIGVNSSNPGATNTGNTATTNGGGIMLIKGTINMQSGVIMNNTASKWGGGVCIGNGAGTYIATFTMTDGHICKNQVTNASTGKGGGVYVTEEDSASFIGTGAVDAEIKGNTKDGSPNNVEWAASGASYIKGNVKVGGESGEGDSCSWVPVP
jgi:hypothetical protein